jgi:hypothetical protein
LEELVSVIQATIDYLHRSEDSPWGSQTIVELVNALEHALQNINQKGIFDKNELSFLFAPTGSLQEIANDNSWGEDFIQLSTVIDQYAKS